jgi:hypothetical protein
MKAKICSPGIFSRAIFAGFTLLGSTSVLAQTGDSTAVQSRVAAGQRVQVEGQLEILHQDFTDGRGLYSYFLRKSDGTRVSLKFTKQPPTHLLTGAHVRADGQLSGGNLILYSGNTNLTSTTTSSQSGSASSIPVPNTFGPQSVLVILVNFQDDAVQPFTVADVQNAFFNTANNFFAENSYGQTSLAGSAVGWYTIPDSVTTCNTSQIAVDAQNAATAAGVTLTSFSRYVYVFPYNTNCAFAGSSTVGGNPSESWINGSLEYHTIQHELGHAFGLWHSHWLNCGSSAIICSNGTVYEYGDLMDTMGMVQTPSPDYNAFQKERLGWLNYGASPSVQTVTSSGTYTIYPYELGGSGPNALKVLQSTDSTTGAKTWYYLEQRQAIGWDAFLTNGTCSPCYTQNETTGVLFHLGTDGDGNSSELIDMTPTTPSTGYYDPSLTVGQSFQDPGAGVTFTPTAVSSAGATVQITMNGSTCIAASPTVTVSPSQSQSVNAGTPISFSLSIKDNDSSSCAPATFNLGDYLPSGWSGVLSTPALSLSPGKSGFATVTATSPMGTANGDYNIGVSATNASANTYNGSANATYVVSSSVTQSISVTANPSTVSAGQTVALSVTVLSNGSPSAGASVMVSVTAPSGRTQSMTGTTGTNGVAAFTYKLSKRAAAGTYQVQAYITPTTKGAATLGASTSFTVQ